MQPAHKRLEDWYTGHVSLHWRGDKTKPKNKRNIARSATHIAQEVKHGMICCLMHIQWIQRPKKILAQEKEKKERAIKLARMRIVRYLLRLYRESKAKKEIQNRITHRQGKISANTRIVQSPHRINYAETKFRQRSSIKKDEYYKTLRAWPQQDKLGPVLAQQHPRTATFL